MANNYDYYSDMLHLKGIEVVADPVQVVPLDPRGEVLEQLLPQVPHFSGLTKTLSTASPIMGLCVLFQNNLSNPVKEGSLFHPAFRIELVYQYPSLFSISTQYGWVSGIPAGKTFYWEGSHTDVIVSKDDKTALLPMVADVFLALRKIIPEIHSGG